MPSDDGLRLEDFHRLQHLGSQVIEPRKHQAIYILGALRPSQPEASLAREWHGFTHSWGKSRKGKDVVRKTTAKSRFARSLAVVKAWCRTNRHRPAREQRAWLSAVLNGHYAYYGITGNIRRLQEYRYQVARTWHKWLERRTRGR
jgi:RNA-directed DNA polymerase